MRADNFDAAYLVLEAADLIRAAEELRDEARAQYDYLAEESGKPHLLNQGFEAHNRTLRCEVRDRKITLRARGVDLRERCQWSLHDNEKRLDGMEFDREDGDTTESGSYCETMYRLVADEVDHTKMALGKLHEFFGILIDILC